VKSERVPAIAAAHPVAHRGYLYMALALFACGFQLVFITA